MTGQGYSMSSCNIVFHVAVSLLISMSLLLSAAVSIYAQSNSTELTQWFIPLSLGKQLKIKCNGSLVEFVSDCTSPTKCQSLRLVGNNTLECIEDSQSKSNGEQVIFP